MQKKHNSVIMGIIFSVFMMTPMITAMETHEFTIKPVIFGLQGPVLTKEEKEFFTAAQPLGFILFKRNCNNFEQIKALVSSLKACLHHPYKMIMIDEEGGRVTRLPYPIFCNRPPAAQTFAQTYTQNPVEASSAVHENYADIAQTLHYLGMNSNTVPCVDLVYETTHSVISDRSFCVPELLEDPKKKGIAIDSVIDLSFETILATYEKGVLPVMKHLPGHGVAMQDSHMSLPVTGATKEHLYAYDFRVFKSICELLKENDIPHPIAMTAHIVYTDIDYHPATFSQTIIKNVIRKYIGFEGFLISDCLTMGALGGENHEEHSMSERAIFALSAGCDAVLHCNGNLAEMRDITRVAPNLSSQNIQSLRAALDYASTQCKRTLSDDETTSTAEPVAKYRRLSTLLPLLRTIPILRRFII